MDTEQQFINNPPTSDHSSGDQYSTLNVDTLQQPNILQKHLTQAHTLLKTLDTLVIDSQKLQAIITSACHVHRQKLKVLITQISSGKKSALDYAQTALNEQQSAIDIYTNAVRQIAEMKPVKTPLMKPVDIRNKEVQYKRRYIRYNVSEQYLGERYSEVVISMGNYLVLYDYYNNSSDLFEIESGRKIYSTDGQIKSVVSHPKHSRLILNQIVYALEGGDKLRKCQVLKDSYNLTEGVAIHDNGVAFAFRYRSKLHFYSFMNGSYQKFAIPSVRKSQFLQRDSADVWNLRYEGAGNDGQFYYMVGNRHIYNMMVPLDVIGHAPGTNLWCKQVISYKINVPDHIIDYQLANKQHIVVMTNIAVEVIDQFTLNRLCLYSRPQSAPLLALAPNYDTSILPCFFNLRYMYKYWPLVDIQESGCEGEICVSQNYDRVYYIPQQSEEDVTMVGLTKDGKVYFIRVSQQEE
ncbi:hypothetical protein FGO68_gene11775 [Halteria grandinella]|uniref:Uncharacterized protein n=1 Tax=Halteria grandinella TaxID=5974 RepID=A0A8J8NFJ5_HALGN|nr:hypothetical protein FGO68_gene11775 [Halteria grandinella]